MKKRNPSLFSFGLLLLLLALFSFNNRKTQISLSPAADTTMLPAFALAKAHKGKNTVSRNGLVTLTSGLDNEYYLFDSSNRTGYLYVETKTDSFVHAAAQKLPLNIAIVIDRSGSMAGEKMDFAKKAAQAIVDKLTAEDFVSVVIYDELIDVIQTATAVLHKDSIKAKIAKIKPRGSTNLWGGSERGYEQVRANFKKNYVNRVLLISDGLVTAGVKIPSRILERVQEFKDIDGITISTFGVGLDYNETLMTDMAENGAGNYYFIDRADKMEAMFDKEVNGLLNVVAQDAELRILLPKGVTVDRLFPFKYMQIKNEVVIRFRDLSSQETKGVVMRFKLENGVKEELKFQTKLVYTDIESKQQKTVLHEQVLAPIRDNETYFTHFNKAVAEQVVLYTTNENLEKAMLEADRGNYEAARRYAEANGYYFVNNAAYVRSSRELKKLDSMNRYYVEDLARAKALGADSVKLMQKSKRALNYQIRNKKQE